MSLEEKSNAEIDVVRVTFADFVDLQTRLVLLPRVEEEGRGAVVSSYDAGTSSNSTHSKEEPTTTTTLQSTAEPTREEETRDDEASATAGITKKKCYIGYSLAGLESSLKSDHWQNKDFATILALLRQEGTKPLTLLLEAPEKLEEASAASKEDNEKSSVEESPVETTTITTTSETTQENAKPNLTSQESLQVGMSVLSSWGVRMRAQATEAASNLSTVAMERAKNFQSPAKEMVKYKIGASTAVKTCDVFMQTSVGAFVPAAVAQSKVTTSSLLLVRKSATEAAPKSGWTVQWYRSSFPNESWADDGASLASGTSGSATSSSGATPEASAPQGCEDLEWTAIEGATNAAFQPDATLMGRHLRCIVTIEPEEPTSSSDESSQDCLEDADLQSVEAAQQVIDLPGVIAADSTLFNAARQALARGAMFGGIRGRGNAQGRHFRVEIAIGMPSKKRSRLTTSSIMVHQMSGTESLALTPKPILQATVQVPSANPKHLDLKIAVSSDTILSALCTDGFLQLEMSNRLARESFLMTLGIANFTGKPAQLDTRTVLFKDEPMRSLMDEEVSVVSSGSGALSVRSQGSGRKSLVASPKVGSMISPTPSDHSPGSPVQSLSPALERSATTLESSLVDESSTAGDDGNRVAALERELEFMRGKLARKDKVVGELQRQITQSDAAHEKTRTALGRCQQELQQSRVEREALSQSLQKVEGYTKSHEARMLRLEGDHARKVAALESRIDSQNSKIADLEKANRSLQNEKAVLQAAIEARESKLTRMAELQSSFDELSSKMAQHNALRSELEAANQRYQDIQQDLQKVEAVEKECRAELASARTSMEELTKRMEQERDTTASCRSQFDTLQKKIQLLKGERNSFKQKNESLSKEVARLCKNGRSIKDIEKILADHQLLLEEMEALRQQKRKALEDAHQYRTSYQRSRAAHELAGTDGETRAALERTAELERLLAELTEYVTAKEMQLETMKQVNKQLQQEIHSLAQANLDKNEV